MNNEGLCAARVIDLHAHVVIEETIGAAGSFGPFMGHHADGTPFFQVGANYRLDGVRYTGSPFMDVEVRLKRMAERGIDFQVLSPNPLTYFHFIPVEDAVRFCRVHNDAAAEIVRHHPDRLAAFAAIPLQSPQEAAREMRRAVTELGLVGAAFGTDTHLRLDDPAYDVLYAEAVRLDVPLSVHPGPAGIDGPPGDPALKRFDLDIISGFAAQETLAVATLIYGGVLDRHPGLDICVSHGGGATALLMGRMAKGARKRPWSPAALRPPGAFEARLKRLWFDTHVDHPLVIPLLAAAVGDDHLVYGTNFAGWDEPDAPTAADTSTPAATAADTSTPATFAGSPVSNGKGPALADNARRLLRVKPSK